MSSSAPPPPSPPSSSAPASRIRIGFIGLSASSTWASQAHLPYLQSALGRRTYEIVALCNSSTAAAQAAIAAHDLPASVAAYGSASELAADPSVDLVVVCVKAPLHLSVAGPAVRAGKRLFVEYPLGAGAAESRRLAASAAQAGLGPGDLLVGLEEAYDACVARVRALVGSGLVGRVVHSSFDACGYPLAGRVAAAHEYALDRRGGASFNGISHLINAVTFALGPLAALHARDLNMQPAVDIVAGGDPADPHADVLRTVAKDTADHTVYSGRFATVVGGEAEEGVVGGAALSGQFRTDKKWPGEPTIVWRIMGEKGQLRISVPGMLSFEFDDGTTIEHFDYASGEVKTVEWRRGRGEGAGGNEADHEAEKILAALPGPARSMGRMYEAFARGEHVGAADWERGLSIHELLEEALGAEDA